MTQKELPGFNRYKDFRTRRFQHALTQQVLLENGNLYPETRYGLSHQEAQRIIGYAIVVLYADILRQGETREKIDAVEAIRMLEYFIHPDKIGIHPKEGFILFHAPIPYF